MTLKHANSAFAIALSRRRQALLVVVAGLLALIPVHNAVARQAGGPLADVIGRSTMSPADLDLIRQYTGPRITDLTGQDSGARAAARRDLLAPFMGDNASVSFRIAYGDEIMPVLQRLVRGANEAGAIGALRIAGALGTTQGEQLAAEALASPSVAVRFAAASAYSDIFRAIASGQAAIPGGQLDPMLQLVGDAMADEADIFVVDAFLRAFDAARDNDTMRVLAMEAAFEALSRQVQRRRRGGDVNDLQVAETALRGVAMSQAMIINLGAGIPQGTAQAAANLTGQSMAFAIEMIQGAGGLGALGQEQSDTIGALLRASETTAALAHTALSSTLPPAGQPMDRALNRQDITALRRAIDAWIGQGGVLTQAPHSGDAASFQ